MGEKSEPRQKHTSLEVWKAEKSKAVTYDR